MKHGWFSKEYVINKVLVYPNEVASEWQVTIFTAKRKPKILGRIIFLISIQTMNSINVGAEVPWKTRRANIRNALLNLPKTMNFNQIGRE